MPLSFAVLRLRDFRLLLFARLFGTTAMQAQAVIVGWQVYSLTHSTLMLGLTGLAEALPAIVCAFFAGHFVDRYRPHRVLLLCIGVQVVNMLMLLLIAGGIVSAPGGDIVPWIFAGIVISGFARSFIMPSTFSLLPQIVARKDMPAAAAWSSSFFQVAMIVGPAVAGIIYGGFGARTAWLLPVSLMSAGFIVLVAISHERRHYRSARRDESATQSLLAGWKFIFTHRALLAVMSLDMLAVLFGGAIAMLPAFADQILHLGSEGLGLLRAGPAIGAVMTALALAVWPFKNIRASVLLWTVAGFGISIIGFGLSTSFWFSILWLTLSGAFDSVSMVIRGTLVQWLTPEAMRGRVSSVNSMFIISSNELGAFESGMAASLLGLVPSIVLGGVATLLVVAGTAFASPKLRRMVVRGEEA